MDLVDKKILVTGGAGFVGSHVVRELLRRGTPRSHITVPRSADDDLRSFDACMRIVKGHAAVIHAAGRTGGIVFHKEHPAETFYDNLMMGIQLMEAARRSGVQKFVTIGSAAEYPEQAPLPCTESDLWRGLPEEIHVPYTIAKKMLLVQAHAYRQQYGFNAVHLLMTNMYGPGERVASSFVIPTLIRRMFEAHRKNVPVVEVWGTGRATRDFLFVEDAAAGIVAALERYDKPDPVNLGSGVEVTIRELAELVKLAVGFGGTLRFDETKPEGRMRRLLDTTRAESEFGWRAATDFRMGLRKTVEEYLPRLRANIAE